MVKKRGSKEKLIEEENENSVILLSSDDDEANEDLSLKIVEKARLRESKRKREETNGFVFDEDDGLRRSSSVTAAKGVIDLSSSSCEDVKVLDRSNGGNNNGFVVTPKVEVERKKKRKKKKKNQKIEQEVGVTEAEEPMGTVISLETEPSGVVETDKLGDTVKADERTELEGTEAVQTSDNIVLRKLLRGPRYFDPPDRNCATCYGCGEEGHNVANCSKRRKKPCFICGSFEHGIRNCSQGQDCFICKNRGHRAKDCPEKHQVNAQENKICLRCGDFGHLMFSCSIDYDPEDLKEIQCYVCKKPGHLCCVASIDPGHKEVSCYNCGQPGHTGTVCAKYRGEGAAAPSTCYKCGEEGHFVRDCANYSKPDRWMGESSTPTKKYSKKRKESLGSRSAPPNLSKVHQKKNIQHEEKDFAAQGRPKRRGGWIPDDSGDISNRKAKNNSWRSPATPTKNGQNNLVQSGGGHSSSSRPPKWKSSPSPRTPSSRGAAYPSNHMPRAANAHGSAYTSTTGISSAHGSPYPTNPPRTPSVHASAYSSNLSPRTPNLHGSAYPPHPMAPTFYPPYPVTPGLAHPYQNTYTPSRFSNSIGSGGRRHYW
ncbi:hypothetical protein AQUCO_00900609v1 [Aquilegia coerulea]|uniref:CCHC-type domain-containing protein n=1 Tax=Aquilegia coerulea TaxID=218851 RepID=A0A2G5EEH5_AQUCA|nr:hypothetical protein AQUCO_00900609v1 [Aquilegia coerulea]